MHLVITSFSTAVLRKGFDVSKIILQKNDQISNAKQAGNNEYSED